MTGLISVKTISSTEAIQSLTLSLIDSQPMKSTSQVAKFKVLLNHLVCYLTLNTQEYWHLSVHQLEGRHDAQVFGLLQHCSSDDSIILQVPEKLLKAWNISDVNGLSVALIRIWDHIIAKDIAVISNGAAGDVLFVEIIKIIAGGLIDTKQQN